MEELMHDDDEDEFRLTLTSEPNPDPQERDVFSGFVYIENKIKIIIHVSYQSMSITGFI